MSSNNNKILIQKNTIKLSGSFLSKPHVSDLHKQPSNRIILAYKNKSADSIFGITQSNVFHNITQKKNTTTNKFLIHKTDTSFPCQTQAPQNITWPSFTYLLESDISHHLLYNVTNEGKTWWKDVLYSVNLYSYYADSYQSPTLQPNTSFSITNLEGSFKHTRHNNIINIDFDKPLINISFEYTVTNKLNNDPLEKDAIFYSQYLFCYITYIDHIILYVLEGETLHTTLNKLISERKITLTNTQYHIRTTKIMPKATFGPKYGSLEVKSTDDNVFITYTPTFKVLRKKYPNAPVHCIKYEDDYENYIGEDTAFIEIWLSDTNGFILEELYITFIIECDNKKCPPKILYNPNQNLAIMGSAKSSKMQKAQRIRQASSYRGRCARESVANPTASMAPSPSINFFNIGTGSQGKKRLKFGFF